LSIEKKDYFDRKISRKIGVYPDLNKPELKKNICHKVSKTQRINLGASPRGELWDDGESSIIP
jgi:hypothetical protein